MMSKTTLFATLKNAGGSSNAHSYSTLHTALVVPPKAAGQHIMQA